MSEIIDCSRGVWTDLDYIYLDKKPPYYTDEEWENKLKVIDNITLSEEVVVQYRAFMEDILKVIG